MPPVSARSRWSLIAILALAVVALSLHGREVVRTGLAIPPVYAIPADGPYPVVGGDTLEVAGSHSLEPGDVLIRVGDQDLAGAGYLGFMGAAFEQAGQSRSASIVYERAGVRGQTELALQPHAVPWMRIPFLGIMLVLVTLILRQRPEEPFIQFTAVTFGAIVIGESIFEGGGIAQTMVAKLVFIFGGLVWWPLVVQFAARVPGDHPTRPPLPGVGPLGALAGLLWTLPKTMYLLGGPVPGPMIPSVVSGADALTIVILAGVFYANYRRSSPPEQRRVRWVLLTAWAAGVTMFAALAMPVVSPGAPGVSQLVATAAISATIIPVGVITAVLGYELFDIDRLVSSAATYSILLIGLLAILLAMVPPLSTGFANLLGANPETTRLLFSMVAAGTVVLLYGWLNPRVDRIFFPERHRIEQRVNAMIAEQALAGDASELATTLAQRVEEIFEPRTVAALAWDGTGAFVPAWSSPDGAISGIAGDRPMVAAMESAAGPVPISSQREDGGYLPTSEDSDWLSAGGTQLLLPIFDQGELLAFVAVGAKRSGDVYQQRESTLLGAVLEAASRQLRLVREAEALGRERVRSEELEAAQLARSRHLAAASHDLRQPLHALQLFSDTLVSVGGEGRVAELAVHIRESSTALRAMFDGLIDMSRMDQGRVVPALSEFPLRPLLDRLCAEAKPEADRKGLGLEAIAPDVWVRSDPVLLGRVLQNLLSNALRYTDTGSVVISAASAESEVSVRVQDTGAGIAAAEQDAVFEEFVRLRSASAPGGLGLGLSIVRGLCDLLGHELTLESEPGVGTTFTIGVPGAHETFEAKGGAVTSSDPVAGCRILVVDDDLEVLQAMHGLLESWGARVSLAATSEEAIDSVEGDGPPDIALVDYHLRDELGTQLVAKLRSLLGAALPVAIISAAPPEELSTPGAIPLPILTKPVSPAALRAQLTELLRGQRDSH